MAVDYVEQVANFRLADLPPSTWEALAEPPLRSLPSPVAEVRRERIMAIPFTHLYGVVALLSAMRPDDTLTALELLGVIESAADEAEPQPQPVSPARSRSRAAAARGQRPAAEPAGVEAPEGGAPAEAAEAGQPVAQAVVQPAPASPMPDPPVVEPAPAVEPSPPEPAIPEPVIPAPAAMPQRRLLMLPAALPPIALLLPVIQREGQRACEICGASFAPLRRHRYCSPACARQAKQNRKQRLRGRTICSSSSELAADAIERRSHAKGRWQSPMLPAARALPLVPKRVAPLAQPGESTATERHCAACGVAFQSQRFRRFCSPKCRSAQRRERRRQPQAMAIRQCQQCGADYLPRNADCLYCSRACYTQASNIQRRKKRAAARTAKPCIICGTIFTPKLRRTQIICSPECEKARNYQRQGYALPGERPPRDCVVCGTSFQPRGRQIICSEACSRQRERQSKQQLGDQRSARRSALVEQFTPPARWRWLLRQLDELGADRVAEGAGLSTADLANVLAAIRARQLAGE